MPLKEKEVTPEKELAEMDSVVRAVRPLSWKTLGERPLKQEEWMEREVSETRPVRLSEVK